MRGNDDADDVAARRRRVVAILAAGVVRCYSMARKTACSAARESAFSVQNCLGPDDTSRLPVPAGYGQEIVSDGSKTT
jgi:hypothetical protein